MIVLIVNHEQFSERLVVGKDSENHSGCLTSDNDIIVVVDNELTVLF